MSYCIKISAREAKQLETAPAFCALLQRGYLECKRRFLSDIIVIPKENITIIRDLLRKHSVCMAEKDLLSALQVIQSSTKGDL